MLVSFLNKIFDFLYPSVCISCKVRILDENLLCHKCWGSFTFITRPFCELCGYPFKFEISGKVLCGKCIKSPPKYDSARYLFKYDQNSKKLIHSFKYNDQTYLAKIFAKLMLNTYREEIKEYDLIIPVPMHWLKRMLRMYNQASLIAGHLNKMSNIPIIHDCLEKISWTKAQSTLNRNDRMQNLKGSFNIKRHDLIKDKKIILVDDVLTTGATVKECAKLLKKFGATSIMVLTIAAT